MSVFSKIEIFKSSVGKEERLKDFENFNFNLKVQSEDL